MDVTGVMTPYLNVPPVWVSMRTPRAAKRVLTILQHMVAREQVTQYQKPKKDIGLPTVQKKKDRLDLSI